MSEFAIVQNCDDGFMDLGNSEVILGAVVGSPYCPLLGAS